MENSNRNCTLLITTFNRANQLRRSLSANLGKTQPNEILVVDDGGSDNTKKICEEFGAKYIYNDNPGMKICSLARNIGVLNAEHEIIITSEPEMIFESDVISQMLDEHNNFPDKVITAGTIHYENEHQKISVTKQWHATYIALYKKNWIVDIGGWDEEFPGRYGYDDIDLTSRLRLSGHNQIIVPEIQALHQFHGYKDGNDSVENGEYFSNKSFASDDSNLQDLVANKEKEWGKLL